MGEREYDQWGERIKPSAVETYVVKKRVFTVRKIMIATAIVATVLYFALISLALLFYLAIPFLILLGFGLMSIHERRLFSHQNGLASVLVVASEKNAPLAPAIEAYAELCSGKYRVRARDLAERLADGELLPRALAAIPATLLAASLSGCLIDQPMLRTPADPAAPATSAVTSELESRLGPLTGPIALKPAATSTNAQALAINPAYPGVAGGPATAAASPVSTQTPLRTVASDPDATGIAAPHNHGPGADDVGPLTGPIALNPVKPKPLKPQAPRLSTIAMLPGYDSGSTNPRGDKTDKNVKTTSNLINEPASTGAIQAADTLETIPATQQFATHFILCH